MKEVKFKKIDNNVNRNYISKIGNIVDKVRNVSFEVFFDNINVYELDNTIISIMSMRDGTGNMSALIVSNRDKDTKDIIKSINEKDKFAISGSVSFDIDNTYKVLSELTNNKVKKELLKSKVLYVNAINKIEHKKKNEDDILFGIDIVKLYDYDLDKAYNLIKNNTDYLNEISKEEVKEIKFSYYKDIIILLKNGIVLVNGKKKLDNIKTLGFISGIHVFAFSNDNVITSLTGKWENTDFINNNDYKYKTIITNPISIVALTYEKEIRVFGTIVDFIVNYKNYYDVDYIGYIENNDDIVVIKGNEVYSLFNNYTYPPLEYIPEIITGGTFEDMIILE